MSAISVQGEQSTSQEIATLTALTNLAVSGSGQAIQKTGQSTFANVSVGGAGVNFADAEIPTGAINGVNTIFTFAHVPNPAASLIFIVDGQHLAPTGVDFTLVGAVATCNNAPRAGAPVLGWYRY